MTCAGLFYHTQSQTFYGSRCRSWKGIGKIDSGDVRIGLVGYDKVASALIIGMRGRFLRSSERDRKGCSLPAVKFDGAVQLLDQ